MEHQSRSPFRQHIIPPKTGLAAEPLNIVILGASYAGLACAHAFLDETISKLRQSSSSPSYRLIIISPSTHLYWNIAAPRILVEPDAFQHDDMLIPIEPGFHRHRGHQFSIVQGECKALDLEMRMLTVEMYSSESQKKMTNITKRHSVSPVSPTRSKVQMLRYHALILATGSSAHSDLLSLHGPHVGTIGALNTFHTRVAAAKSIVIVGGGCSGVETAGQLATYLNHTSRWPFCRRKRAKQIILVTGSSRCLPELKDKAGIKAERMLKRLGVQVRHCIRVTGIKEEFDLTGQTKIEFDNDSSLIADIYLPCTGVVPNSAYAPPWLLDEQGYIKTNPQTLRVESLPLDARIYAIGDVASYSRNCILDVYAAMPALKHNLLNDLLTFELQLASRYGGNQDAVDEMDDLLYIQDPKTGNQLCPITRFGGVGVRNEAMVPSKMVWSLKGRDYRIGKAKNVVFDGTSPY